MTPFLSNDNNTAWVSTGRTYIDLEALVLDAIARQCTEVGETAQIFILPSPVFWQPWHPHTRLACGFEGHSLMLLWLLLSPVPAGADCLSQVNCQASPVTTRGQCPGRHSEDGPSDCDVSVTFSLSDSINADDDEHGISMSALQVCAHMAPVDPDLNQPPFGQSLGPLTSDACSYAICRLSA